MKKKIFYALLFFQVFSSCKSSLHFWNKGGENAIGIVGIDSRGKEFKHYIPKEVFVEKIQPTFQKTQSGIQELLTHKNDIGSFYFGQIILELTLELGVSIGPIYRGSVRNMTRIYFRNIKYIY